MSSGEPASLFIVREAKAGHGLRYEGVARQMSAAAASFPGFIAAHHSPPASGDTHHITMLQFESVEALRRWEKSSERQQWLQKVEEVAYPAKLATHVTTGLESLFAHGRRSLVPVRPRRYKMVLVMTCVIYTLLLSLRPVLSQLLIDWPDYLSALVLVSTQVLLMTYLIMPVVTRVLAGWLYR